ncbi:MAG: hypothetical protein IJN64_11165 [Lachnospiraceae bacterium]|nr:hypothetical protein [Lachnospiraceae bacterium]
MEKIRGQRKLRSIFIQYLLFEIIGALLLAVVIGVFGFSVLLGHVQKQPRLAEADVEMWIQNSLEAGEILTEKLPENVKVYIFNEEEIFNNLTAEEWKEFQEHLDAAAMIPNNSYIQAIDGSNVYRQYAMLGRRIMVKYQMEATYDVMGVEKKIILFFGIALVVAEILWLVIATGLHARKIRRELQKLTLASVEIGNQNLDFQIEHSNIKEMEDAIESFEIMKNKTKETLEEMWRADKVRCEKNIELAHRIKTALTVIRGNTELMLETPISEEQQGYLETMRKHETEIINYVLDIVQDNDNK